MELQGISESSAITVASLLDEVIEAALSEKSFISPSSSFSNIRQPPCLSGPLNVSVLSKKASRYDSQNESDPEWHKHKVQILIFSFSGKPIYSRYGDEDSLCGLTGTLQSICSRFSELHGSNSDELRYISRGKLNMVFLNKSPLILVSISQFLNKRFASKLLQILHGLVISILTDNVNQTLLARPNFDARSLLGGTTSAFAAAISWFRRDTCLGSLSFPAIEPLPLHPVVRRAITQTLRSGLSGSSPLLVLLLAGHRVVSSLSLSDPVQSFEASDLLILINLICNSASLREGENWVPVCLPKFSSNSFLYSYVSFLSENVCVVVVSGNPESEHFYSISKQVQIVKETLTNTGAMGLIELASETCPIFVPQELIDSFHVIHCAVGLPNSSQVFSSNFRAGTSAKVKEIIQRYSACHELLGDSPMPRQMHVSTRDESSLVWMTSEFELLLTVPRYTESSIDLSEVIYQWVKENEQKLFIPFKIPILPADLQSRMI